MDLFSKDERELKVQKTSTDNLLFCIWPNLRKYFFFTRMIAKPKLQFLENFSLQIFYLLLASPFICIQGTDRDKRQETALQEMSKQFSFLHKLELFSLYFHSIYEILLGLSKML